MRKASNKGIEMIKQLEGCRLSAYKCLDSEDYYTIGYGHYGISDGSLKITQAEANELLEEDLSVIYDALEPADYYYNFTDYEYDALVSFCFNLGSGIITQLTKSYTRTKGQIADAIPFYNHSGSQVIEGLTRRRNIERDLFILGVYPDGSTYEPNSQSSDAITESTTLGQLVDMIIADKFGTDNDRKEALYNTIQNLVNKRYGID